MNSDEFKLRSAEEVREFERLLRLYSMSHAGMDIVHLPLGRAFESAISSPDGGRLFAALFDIQLSHLALAVDMFGAQSIWNSTFSKGKHEGGSVLDSQAKFNGKMELYRLFSGFILRYRALWDKLMGAFILLYAPTRYDQFASARRKRRTFVRIAGDISDLDGTVVEQISSAIERFDVQFRTAEAHGSGVLRKWAFLMNPMHENPTIELLGNWNLLNHYMTQLAQEAAGPSPD